MGINSTIRLIKKLQKAINIKFPDQPILYSTSQFFSSQQQVACTCHHIRQVINPHDKHTESVELFKSYNVTHVVLYMRDLWYTLNGWELPTDNAMWNAIREGNKNAKATNI